MNKTFCIAKQFLIVLNTKFGKIETSGQYGIKGSERYKTSKVKEKRDKRDSDRTNQCCTKQKKHCYRVILKTANKTN